MKTGKRSTGWAGRKQIGGRGRLRRRRTVARLGTWESLEDRRLLAGVSLDWVTVGDASNEWDVNGYGSVTREFRIMKFEFTNAQYVTFLNAVDPQGTNPNDIWSTSMGSEARGGISFVSGNAAGGKYVVKANMGDKPVNYVSWFDAARVANWLHNGAQTYGASVATAAAPQNTGAYSLSTATSGRLPSKNAGAKFSIATENEWYKAAFYNVRGSSRWYADYATRSSSAPTTVTASATGVGSAGATGNYANFASAADWNGQDGNVTTVGTNGGPSGYGTFDQFGNVYEWVDDASADRLVSGIRGGGYSSGSSSSKERVTFIDSAGLEAAWLGFRLAGSAVAPDAPTDVGGTPGNASVSLAWTAPAATSGATITDYIVEYKATTAATWTTFADGISTGTSATVTGLTNGTSYAFRVSAVNSVGTGAVSLPSSSVTPRTVPGQPTSVSGSPGDARVTLSWAAPASTGGAAITDYVVQYKTTSAATWTTFVDAVSTIRSTTVTGLANGESYVFRVSAVNAAGTGTPSDQSAAVTPVGAPAAPTGVVATAQRGYATVSWAAPASDGGSPITSYNVESSADGGSTWSAGLTTASGVTSARVDSLYDGATYRFRVTATNSLGTSVPSTLSAAVTLPRQPGWPVQVGATGEDGVASIVTVGGATIVTGSFTGAVQFGPTTLTSAGGSEDVFVAKLNADGSYAWAVRAGGAGSDRGTKIAALADGTVAVIGSFTGSAAFGGTMLTSSGSGSFIAKIRLDDGTFAWARRAGDAGTPWASGIDAVAGGGMIVTGEYYGTTTFGGTTLPSYATYDAFVAKLNAAGSYVWAVRAGAPDPLSFGSPSPMMTAISPGGIATLPDGSAYVAGYFTGTVAFGSTVLTTPSTSSMDRSLFVAKVTPGGTFAWVRQSADANYANSVSDVAVWGNEVLVAGTFRDYLSIAGTSLSGSGYEAFLAQWTADGSPMGALRVGGSGDDFGGSISGRFLTGVFDTSATFGGTGSTAPPFSQYLTGSSQQAFVAAFSSYGTASPGYEPGFISWAAPTPGGRYFGSGAAPDVATLSDGSPVVGGQFSGAAVFGTTQLSSAGGSDGFIARMYPSASSTSFSAWSYDGLGVVPTDVTGVPGNGQVALTWLATSGSADYLIEYSSDGGVTWTTFNDGVSSATSATVTGLANGTAYRFRVSAIDAGRAGRPSQLSAAMTPTLVRPAGWPKQAAGNSIDSLVVFGDGSAAVTGGFSGSGVFGSTTVTGTNPLVNGGTYAARLAADGAFSWAREAQGGIAAAAAGGATLVAGTKDVYYTGGDMAGIWQPSFSATHMVVSQLKADGSTGWRYSEGATPFPGMYPQPGYGSAVQPQAITTLPDGSVVVAGMRNDYYSSYPTTMNTPVFFLRKINADGSAGWGQSSSAPTMYGFGYYDTVTSLTAFADGSTLLAGRFGDQLPFGSSAPSPSPAPSSGRAFVTKLAADGTVAWSRQFDEFVDPTMPPYYSSYGDVTVAAMTTLPDGTSLVAGSFSGTVTFGSTTLVAADFSDGFIVKLAADGAVVWAQALDADVAGITTLTDGSVLASGTFAGSLTVGAETLTSAGDADAFVLKIAPTGTYTWARRIGGTGWDAGGKIAALPDGSALVAGRFSGTASFGAVTLTSGGTDLFIAKIGADGVFQSPSAPITVAAGQTVTDTTVRTGGAQLVKQGLGTLVLDLANAHTGGTVVEAGEVSVRNISALGTGTVVVRPGARITLGVGANAVPLAGIIVEVGGRVDVGTGRIVMGPGTFDLPAIRGYLAVGHNAGATPGSSGITSAAAAATPGRAVGYTVDGGGNLVVSYAAFGDTNLDGVVDFDDIVAVVSSGRFDSGQPGTWDTGDFDYNGVVDFDDVLAMVSAGRFDQGPYLPSQAINSAANFAAFDPAQAMFDPAAAAFASLAAEQVATGDGATRKKQATIRPPQ